MKGLFIIAAALSCGFGTLRAAEGIAIQPGRIFLHGPESSQRLLVLNTDPRGEFTGEAGKNFDWKSSDTAVAVVRHGFVLP